MNSRRLVRPALGRFVAVGLALEGIVLASLALPGAAQASTPNSRVWNGSSAFNPINFEPGTFKLMSTGGAYTAIWQTDGNFVVYHNPGHAIWSSNTIKYKNFTQYFYLNPDGGIGVHYHCGPSCRILANWQNNYHDNFPDGHQYKLTMQTDGNLVEYLSGKAVWATQTDGE